MLNRCSPLKHPPPPSTPLLPRECPPLSRSPSHHGHVPAQALSLDAAAPLRDQAIMQVGVPARRAAAAAHLRTPADLSAPSPRPSIVLIILR